MSQTIPAPRAGAPSINRNSMLSMTSAVSNFDELGLDDLQQYILQLESRPFAIMPPVVAGGLPSLDSMNIPFYDANQYKYNPTTDQKKTNKVQAKRGPRYMLTFLHKNMGYRWLTRDNELSAVSTLASTIGPHGQSTGSLALPLQIQLPPTPTSPVTPQSSQSNRKSVLSKLKQKVSIRQLAPSTPEASEHEDSSSLSSGRSNTSLSATQNTAVPSSASSIPHHQFNLDFLEEPSSRPASRAFSTEAKRKRSLMGMVSNKLTLNPTASPPSRRASSIFSQNPATSSKFAKKSHKYLANMGTIQLPGSSEKRDFELIIDPKFPHSYISMDAIRRETASIDNNSNSRVLNEAFQVVATPVYNPESEYNRVTIEITLIPIPATPTVTVEAEVVPDHDAALEVEDEVEKLAQLPSDQTRHSRNSFSSKLSFPPLPALPSPTGQHSRSNSITAPVSPIPSPAGAVTMTNASSFASQDMILNYKKAYLNSSVTYKEMMLNSCQPRSNTNLRESPRAMSSNSPNRMSNGFTPTKPSPDQPHHGHHVSSSSFSSFSSSSSFSTSSSFSLSAIYANLPISRPPSPPALYPDEITVTAPTKAATTPLSMLLPASPTVTKVSSSKASLKKPAPLSAFQQAAATPSGAVPLGRRSRISPPVTAPSFNVFSGQLVPTANAGRPQLTTAQKRLLEQERNERLEQEKLELQLQNEMFSKQWKEASLGLIEILDLKSHNCILGRDWIERLHIEAYKEELELDMQEDHTENEDISGSARSGEDLQARFAMV